MIVELSDTTSVGAIRTVFCPGQRICRYTTACQAVAFQKYLGHSIIKSTQSCGEHLPLSVCTFVNASRMQTVSPAISCVTLMNIAAARTSRNDIAVSFETLREAEISQLLVAQYLEVLFKVWKMFRDTRTLSTRRGNVRRGRTSVVWQRMEAKHPSSEGNRPRSLTSKHQGAYQASPRRFKKMPAMPHHFSVGAVPDGRLPTFTFFFASVMRCSWLNFEWENAGSGLS